MDRAIFNYICKHRGLTCWSGLADGKRDFYLGHAYLQDDYTDIIEYDTFEELNNAGLLKQFQTHAIKWLNE